MTRRQYFDLDLTYAFEQGVLGGLVLRAGVENLSDEDLPIFPSGIAFNTDPSQYDVLGRRHYVGANYSY